jgi:hypothetical protein
MPTHNSTAFANTKKNCQNSLQKLLQTSKKNRTTNTPTFSQKAGRKNIKKIKIMNSCQNKKFMWYILQKFKIIITTFRAEEENLGHM